MIDYSNVKVGDILRITGLGAPGFANIGDLVVVEKILPDPGVKVTRAGLSADFVYECGAKRLEPIDLDKFAADLILGEISLHLISVNSAHKDIHICALRQMIYRRVGFSLTLRRVTQTIAAHFPEFKVKKDDIGPYIEADLAIVNKYTK